MDRLPTGPLHWPRHPGGARCRNDRWCGEKLRHVPVMERALGVKLHRVENPQINGALGAAIFAADKVEGLRRD